MLNKTEPNLIGASFCPPDGKDTFVPLTAENSTRLSSSGPRSFPQSPEASSSASRNRFWLLVLVGAVAIFAAYSNHFHNSFHFDDSHTVVDNVFIRDLHNIPRFFTDTTTFSTLPANRVWRPIVSLSLAIDYRLGGGAKPLWFHISTFFWFLLQLALMFVMYRSILDSVEPQAANRYIALFAVMWYGLHPVTAETVNYVIQRGDLYATLGVVAALVMYVRLPALRKFGLYLLPVVIGSMAKTPAVVFCGILLVYIFLFEENADWQRFQAAFVRSIPAFAVCAVLAILNIKLTAKTFSATTMPSSMYWAAQPYVLMRYVRSLFLPLWLSADSDLQPFSSSSDPSALLGFAFCIALLVVAFWCMKRREHRPIAFGIFWFFGASAPTSLFVLSELENDHRMFFPFVGLVLSATWAAALFVQAAIRKNSQNRDRILLFVKLLTAGLLIAYGVGAWERNKVWHAEESLWRDVTVKSPQNGRGLMNYGLTLMSRGDGQGALDYFVRAASFTPNYPTLEINTGVAEAFLNHNQQSEAHFRRAVLLAPQDAQPYYYYGRWLKQQGRASEAIQAEKSAIANNPTWVEPRYLLMQLYLEQAQAAPLRALAEDTLKIIPGDISARQYLANSANIKPPLVVAEQLAEAQPTPEHYLNLSLLYHQAGRYEDCIVTAKKALKLRPEYAEAYNNIAAANEALARWDEAIDAAKHALRINPNFQLAKNNLAWSLSQKKLHAKDH
jgi:protein O-mannosyl-transferase